VIASAAAPADALASDLPLARRRMPSPAICRGRAVGRQDRRRAFTRHSTPEVLSRLDALPTTRAADGSAQTLRPEHDSR
jgi:hypothetical protein